MSNVLSRETLIPLGLVAGAFATLVLIVVYVTNMNADIRSFKEDKIESNARIGTVEARMNLVEKDQTVFKTKIDYITDALEAITKKLNVVVSP